jgi:HPt (histidine-containing phosphotransfer) domain-containing protein
MLDRLMYDEDLVATVIEEFLTEMPQHIEALRRAVELKDMQGAERKSHLIKGAAANVGGDELRAVAFKMERAAKGGEIDFVAAHLDEINLQFLRLKNAITE